MSADDTSSVPVKDGLDPARRALLERVLRDRRVLATPVAGRSDSELNISLFFFSADIDDDPRDKHALVLECAELADELGLHAVWVPERHFDAFGAPYPSPAVLLAAIAMRTSRIGLRSGSVVLPLRDPLLVAEEWGVLDSLSGGRIGMSLASGWHADDFVLNPEGFEHRKQVLEDHLGDLYALWRGDTIQRAGPGGRMVDVRTYPRPRQIPEVWLTSAGNPETWRTAARLNLNVLTAMLEQSLNDIARKAAIYRAALGERGLPVQGREITCMLHAHLAPNDDIALKRAYEPLTRYLTAHLNLFEKFAANQDLGVRPDDVTDADRKALIEHGVRRYMDTSGLFGSIESVAPMIGRLRAAGVTELGCLVDFGLPREHVLESVRELAKLNSRVKEQAVAI
jgi:natural product biosynthesis luciferase-like monooxygenase protein